MIISHKYRYIFTELPLTASTAIAKELIEHYDGQEILHKHASYSKFLKIASEDEKKYFSFSGIRNPLDKAVSHYFKYLSDHKGKYSNPPKKPNKVSQLKFFIDNGVHQRKFKFISSKKATFNAFFMEFYNIPYSDWSLAHHKKMNAVIFFENVVEDFDRALHEIGIEPKRKLPMNNRTSLKDKTFWEYYDTDNARIKAAKIFGPYMDYWGYEFPLEWNVGKFTDKMRASYEFFNLAKIFYWKL